MKKIFTVNNKKEKAVLKTKIPPLDLSEESKKKLRELVREMRKAMKEAQGVGLSANQIGVKKRVFVAEVPSGEGRPKFYAIINPKIVKRFKEEIELEEGCLSVPGRHGIVERPERIVLEGYTIQGKKIKIKAWGFLARVFQHEVDHLDGKLFTDRTKEVYKTDAQNKTIHRRPRT